jgi:hypothetical protein
MEKADFQSRYDKSTAQAEEMKERGAAGFVKRSIIQFLTALLKQIECVGCLVP